jgi:hypothetical protein
MKTLRVLLIWIATAGALCAVMSGQARRDVDLIVSGGIVVTMDGARAIVQDGSVAVKGDAIVAVGPRAHRSLMRGGGWCCRGSSTGIRMCR